MDDESLSPSQDHTHLQIKPRVEAIQLTLSLIAQRDQRVGVRSLYGNKQFTDVVEAYYDHTVVLSLDGVTKENVERLKYSVQDFVAFTRSLFPSDHSRMLTALRTTFGKSFSVLYKNSVILNTILDYVFDTMSDDDQSISPMRLPEQQSAPIYTKVENDRVVLDSGHSLHPFLRTDAVEKTRQYLKRELIQIEKALAASNIDQRYVDAFSRLSELVEFSDDAAAISFGLHIRTMSMITKKVEEELSGILAVQIAATLTHAAFFASQYKDWIDFLNNAQSFQTRDVTELEMDPALTSIVALLEENPQSIDERIPLTIKLIATLLSGDAEDKKQAIYAGIRSIENFFISSITYGYEQAKSLLEDAGAAARPKLVNLGAFAIITVAIAVIGHFMPIIISTSELTWVLENLPNIKKISNILKP